MVVVKLTVPPAASAAIRKLNFYLWPHVIIGKVVNRPAVSKGVS